MERYTLLISHNNSANESVRYLQSYVHSGRKLSRHSFLVILNVTPTDKSSDILLSSRDCVGWKEFEDLDEDLNSIHVKNWTTLAAAINILADGLPEIGQYFVDVLCCGEVFLTHLPEEKVEISFSLERLSRWHNAHIVFQRPVITCPAQIHVLDKWAWWFCGSVCNDDWPFVDLKLWHGSLSLSETLSFDGFELVYFGDQEQLVTDACSHSYLKKLLFSKEITHVSTSFEFLMESEQLAIPPYLYTPIKFILQLPQKKQTFQSCHSFIEYLETRPTYSLVFSLDFTCSGAGQDRSKYDFESWARSFQTGKVPEGCLQTSLPDDCPHFTFVVYYDPALCQTSRSLVAHLLMDPSDLNVTHILPYVLESKLPIDLGEDVNWYADIPKLDEGMSPEDTDPVKNSFGSQCVDPSDWPERRYLLLKELKRQKRNHNLLDGLLPPTSHKKVIHFKLNDLVNYFDSSGQPRKGNHCRSENGDNIIIGGKAKNSIKVHHTFEEIQKCTWPDIQHCRYHDIYFNHSSWREEQEFTCNQLKEQFVLDETSSSDPSCNKPWIVCSVPHNQDKVCLKRKVELPPKLRRCKSATSSSVYAKQHSVSPRKSKESIKRSSSKVHPQCTKENRPDKHPHLKKAIQFIHNPKPMMRLSETQSDILTRKDELQSFEDNIRRSPRFKMKQALNSSATMIKPKGSDELTEKHKKKLREAVALALESEGIMLNSPSFKLCGRRLFNVCKAFIHDILGKGNTSALMKKIAAAHVKQVIEFENIKS